MPPATLHSLVYSATLHCLSGCAIGEILGLVIGTALGLMALTTVVLAVTLAFIIGYALSLWPIYQSGVALKIARSAVLAAYPVNKYLLSRGKGHALIHGLMGHDMAGSSNRAQHGAHH